MLTPKLGKLCIEVDPSSKIAFISEDLCIGCGICPKKCPFEAIQIINLPTNLEKDTTHRYAANAFKLHRLPIPRPGQVLGLVGTNGIGKSTALKILAGKLKPNLGRFSVRVEFFALEFCLVPYNSVEGEIRGMGHSRPSMLTPITNTGRARLGRGP